MLGRIEPSCVRMTFGIFTMPNFSLAKQNSSELVIAGSTRMDFVRFFPLTIAEMVNLKEVTCELEAGALASSDSS